eukprot:scaffold14591_cov65-Phaeocystis_antarctica.AAC.2
MGTARRLDGARPLLFPPALAHVALDLAPRLVVPRVPHVQAEVLAGRQHHAPPLVGPLHPALCDGHVTHADRLITRFVIVAAEACRDELAPRGAADVLPLLRVSLEVEDFLLRPLLAPQWHVPVHVVRGRVDLTACVAGDHQCVTVALHDAARGRCHLRHDHAARHGAAVW